jgi:hypothetical protein
MMKTGHKKTNLPMNVMYRQQTSKGWYHYANHIGMDADSATGFPDFYAARS